MFIIDKNLNLRNLQLVEGIMFRLLVVYCFLSAIIWECKSENETCEYIKDNGDREPGLCKKLNDCPMLKKLFTTHSIIPEWCLNGRKKRITCCPFPAKGPGRPHNNGTSAQSIFYYYQSLIYNF